MTKFQSVLQSKNRKKRRHKKLQRNSPSRVIQETFSTVDVRVIMEPSAGKCFKETCVNRQNTCPVEGPQSVLSIPNRHLIALDRDSISSHLDYMNQQNDSNEIGV